MGNENKNNILIKNVNKYQKNCLFIDRLLNSGLYNITRIPSKSNTKCTLTKDGINVILNLIDINEKTKYIDKYYQKANCIILEMGEINYNNFENLKLIWSKDIKEFINTNLVYLITKNNSYEYISEDLKNKIKEYAKSDNLKYYNISINFDIKSLLDDILFELEICHHNNINKINNEIIVPPKKQYKVIFVGDTYYSCKTTFIKTIIDEKRLEEGPLSCHSGNYITKKINLKNGMSINLDLWDVFGHETFRSLAKLFIKGYDCAVFGYDITNKVSFYNATNMWYKLILESEPAKLMYLIGHKSDLFEKQEVSTEEAKNAAEKLNMRFFEVSCKEYYNIKEFIDDLANEIIKI